MEHLSKKRILVTGGSGYIGAEIFKKVKESSAECLSVDILVDPVKNSPPQRPFVRPVRDKSLNGAGGVYKGANESGNIVALDLKDAVKTQKLITDFNPDAVIHCATYSALAYRDNLLNSFQEDFSVTKNILNVLKGKPDCRLIYFSSSYVYSGLPMGEQYDENSPLLPKHNFGIAKSFFEQLILKIHPNTVIFRLCSVFGPGQAAYPNVVLAFAKECLNKGSLTVWGKGERKLQYIFMEDVVEVILKSCSAEGGPSSGRDLPAGIYNLGGDDYISVKDTAETIAKFFRVKVNFLENKPEGETLPFLSNQKIKSSLGDELFTDFPNALNKYLMSLQHGQK